MRIHLKNKKNGDEAVYCGADFHPLSYDETSSTKAKKVTCRTCKKIWGKNLWEKLIKSR